MPNRQLAKALMASLDDLRRAGLLHHIPRSELYRSRISTIRAMRFPGMDTIGDPEAPTAQAITGLPEPLP
jgi:hypothetical protein